MFHCGLTDLYLACYDCYMKNINAFKNDVFVLSMNCLYLSFVYFHFLFEFFFNDLPEVLVFKQ